MRNTPELSHGYVDNVNNIPLGDIQNKLLKGEKIEKLPSDKIAYFHCKSGARSMMACSLLKKAGYTNINNIEGGYDAILLNTNLKF